MSASAVKITGDTIHTPNGKEPHETPRSLETVEVASVVEDYRLAAERARDAGFDGVEIHAANGYLIDQFLQSKTNRRTDLYGGSVENRFRFLREIVETILSVWPSARVGVRLSPNGNFNDMYTQDSAEEAIETGKADLIAFGRPFLSNPDLVERFANGWELNPPADVKVWSAPTEVGYTDFPFHPQP